MNLLTRSGGTILAAGLLLGGCGGGGSDGSDIGSSSTSTLSPPENGFASFQNNFNDDVILDANNEEFRVSSSSRQVVDRSGVELAGLTVDTSANIVLRGVVIGNVSYGTSTRGNTIVLMKCSNSTSLDLTVAASGWSYRCGTGSTVTGSGSGSPPSARSFMNWSGSANGDVVIDANDERFKFYADTRCVYSVNTTKEYSNFCLDSGATVSFSGTTYSVTYVRATNGSCITGLLTSDGFYADFSTSSTSIQFVGKSSKKPVFC